MFRARSKMLYIKNKKKWTTPCMEQSIAKKPSKRKDQQKKGWRGSAEVERTKQLRSPAGQLAPTTYYLLLWSGLGPVMTSLLSSSPSAPPRPPFATTTGSINPFAKIASPWWRRLISNLLPRSSPPVRWWKQQGEEQLTTLWNCIRSSSDTSKTRGMSLSSLLLLRSSIIYPSDSAWC